MNFSILTILTFLSCLPSMAAPLAGKLQLESNLQSRIEKLVTAYDDKAKVLLTLKLVEPTDSVLPGTSLQGIDSQTVEEKIESAEIVIFTEEEKFEDSFLKMASTTLGLSENQIKLNYKKSKKTAKKEDWLDKAYFDNLLNGSSTKLSTALIWGLGSVYVFALFLTIIVLFQKKRLNDKLANDVSGAINNLQESNAFGGGSASSAQTSSLKIENGTPFTAGDKSGIDLPNASIVEALADCYWTESDSEAKYFWQQLHIDQKMYCLESFLPTRDYINSLQNTEATPWTGYDHPYYLKPLGLKLFSQNDLKLELKSKIQLWHQLPPLRKQKLDLSLQQRLQMIKSPYKSEPVLLNSKEPVYRKLSFAGEKVLLTREQEEQLLENMNLVSEELRPLFPSLIWYSLLSQKEIQNILEKLDAKSIADCLWAPEKIQTLMLSALPEKKRLLVENYLNKSTPQRENSNYSYLVERCLQALSETKQDHEKLAS